MNNALTSSVNSGKKVVVTGGSGFLGKALARRLAKEGYSVVTLSRRVVPELLQEGIHSYSCDLTRLHEIQFRSVLEEALHRAEAVFHVAAKVDMWGRYDDFYKANVQATLDLINASKEAGVGHFIYTSSPSVISGKHDLNGVDESYPYPHSYLASYPKTKAIAEKMVLGAHASSFKTIALRPHLIFGPQDTSLIPAILDKAKSGRLKIIGEGKNLVDFTYIDDCVEAHILALIALKRDAQTGGQPYFVSQGDPVPLWWFVNEILRGHGLPPITSHVSYRVAYALASLFEGAATLIPALGEPLLCRFLVSEMATSHYFSLEKARDNLGYNPKYTVQQALKYTLSRGDKETFSGQEAI